MLKKIKKETKNGLVTLMNRMYLKQLINSK